MLTKSAVLACAFLCSLASPAYAQSSPAPTPSPAVLDDKWHLAVTPYLWLPNVNGTLNFTRKTVLPVPPGGSDTVNIGVGTGPSSYLANLNSGFLVAFEARRYGFSVFGDYINANLSTSVSNVRTITGPGGKLELPISSSVNTHMFNGIFSVGLGATLASGPAGNFDIGAGLRNVNLHASADYALTGPITEVPVIGSLDAREQLTDVTFDVRGRLNLGQRWYAPYYGDIGTGNNNSTWQYVLGVAYAGRTNDVIFAYRNLGYNENGNGLLQNIRIGGPLLGLRIHW